MILLNLKLRLANVTESTKSSLSAKDTDNDHYNPCQWLKDNVYCTNQPTENIKEYFEEKEILVYCKNYYKC